MPRVPADESGFHFWWLGSRGHTHLSCGGKWEQPLGPLDLFGVLAASSWWQISVAHKEEHCAQRGGQRWDGCLRRWCARGWEGLQGYLSGAAGAGGDALRATHPCQPREFLVDAQLPTSSSFTPPGAGVLNWGWRCGWDLDVRRGRRRASPWHGGGDKPTAS